MSSKMSIWSTPDVIEIWTYGVLIQTIHPKSQALHMSSGIIHLEYCRWHDNHDIWSTPDIVRDWHLEFLSTPTLKHSRCNLEYFKYHPENGYLDYSKCLFKWYISSTPDVISGVHIIPSLLTPEDTQILLQDLQMSPHLSTHHYYV